MIRLTQILGQFNTVPTLKLQTQVKILEHRMSLQSKELDYLRKQLSEISNTQERSTEQQQRFNKEVTEFTIRPLSFTRRNPTVQQIRERAKVQTLSKMLKTQSNELRGISEQQGALFKEFAEASKKQKKFNRAVPYALFCGLLYQELPSVEQKEKTLQTEELPQDNQQG